MQKKKVVIYSEEVKTKIVSGIISGEYLLEEAMSIYGIKSRITIIRWLKKCKENNGAISFKDSTQKESVKLLDEFP